MTLISRDLAHLWHPCTQMKEHEILPLLPVVSAKGCYLHLSDGRRILDAISSWWCKSLGHGHPRLKAALMRQLEEFEHVILAGTTNETIVSLSEALSTLMPGLNKVFYASEGSSAVEIAMKMSLQTRVLSGDSARTKFIALQNGYHGETLGALSLSDVGLFREPFAPMLLPVHFIKGLPYVSGMSDALSENCEVAWPAIEAQLAPFAHTGTALIVEPIVQGAGGMKIYSADCLRRLREWTNQQGIHLIADEIMTGMGRTGKMFACEHAGITPDFMCLSKGLTSGFLPLSAVLTSPSIYDYFYQDDFSKGFLHSHTYSGNALAASVALETLRIMQEESMVLKAAQLGERMLANMQSIADRTGELSHVRGIGALVAAEMKRPLSRAAHLQMKQRASDLGILLRPIGQTIYWLPPFVANENDLFIMSEVTESILNSLN